MVRHARGGRSEIAVGLDHDRATLTLRLRDFDVEPWDLSQAPEPDLSLPLEERRPGGLGLRLVRQVTNDLRYEHADGVTTVTAELPVTA
jgi:anti-sigma regulatory factor (Ser/Thr protein kinase)